MKSTILDISGVLLVSGAAFFAWPPLALLVLGVACLLASWRMSTPGDGS